MHTSVNPIDPSEASRTGALVSAALRQAVFDGQLTAAFQPIVAPYTREVVGVEVLARWTHPDLGDVLPVIFVAEIERLGLSELFDSWMLRLACEALAGKSADPSAIVPIHVNLSPYTLMRDGVAERLLVLLGDHQVTPEQVCFELIDDAHLSTLGIEQLAVLRAAGSRVAIDDFAAGPASRDRLLALGVDQVKLDPSITTSLSASSASRAVARATVDLATEFGIEVVAEGVGSVAQERMLQGLGVHAMQGFLFTRPVVSFDEALSMSLPPSYSAPERHPREAERLEALRAYRVLDTAPEDAFDTLTALAAEICGTEIALVSLVDEARQWFKSSVGLDASETPSDISFCGHAILGSDVMMVNDATKDDRFAGNPLVGGSPAIRMYAGAPLVAKNGLAVGTLCVIGGVPGQLDERQLNLLRTLAAQVVAHLELRAASSQLAEALEARDEAEAALRHEATHDQLTDLANRRLFVSTLEQAAADCGAGIVYIDLDGFKDVNDTYGHHVGDELLIWTAGALRSAVRSDDLVARIGGDEFAIIVRDGAGRTRAIADRVRETLCGPVAVADQLLESAVSVGMGYCMPGASPAGALRAADRAMYDEKRARRAG